MRLARELERFKRNLDFLLYEMALEARGIPLTLYLDTADVRDATLGMYAFHPLEVRTMREDFGGKEAGRDSTLIHCLAACGWLGPFHLLPPHQVEYLRMLNADFGLENAPEPMTFSRRFLQALVEEGVVDPSVTTVEGDTDEKLLQAMRRYLLSAMDYFKVVQCITGTWQTRLSTWMEAELFRLDAGEEVDLAVILRSPIFHRVKTAFDGLRPLRAMNNIADAVAIALLIQAVQQSKEGDARRIVCMYTPQANLFWRVIEEADLKTELEYTAEDGMPISVLRDEGYFVFKSTFRPPEDILKDVEGHTPFSAGQDEIRRLRDDVAGLLKEPEYLMSQQVNNIVAFGKPLSTFLNELRDFSFLENVWVPFCAEYDVQEAVAKLREAQQAHEAALGAAPADADADAAVAGATGQVETPAFQQGVQVLRETLIRNTRRLERLMDLWRQLVKAPEHLRNYIPRSRRGSGQQSNLLRDFGLWQFGFARGAHRRISAVLRQLSSEFEQEEKTGCLDVISAYFDALKPPTEKGPAGIERWSNNLATAAATLFAAAMYDEAVDLLQDVEQRSELPGLPQFAFYILYADALSEQERRGQTDQPAEDRRTRIREITIRLENLYRNPSPDHASANPPAPGASDSAEAWPLAYLSATERADLALGLGYLYFRLWRCHGGEDRRSVRSSDDTCKVDLPAWINKAVEYVLEAHDLLHADKPKQVYALNNRLFYMVEPGLVEPENIRSDELMRKTATELNEYKGKANLWQYRYDDTLARYWFLRARSQDTTTPEDWHQRMELASDFIDDARKECPSDPDVERFWHIVHDALANGAPAFLSQPRS